MLELALIFMVKFHASSHKRILRIINTGLLVGIFQESVVVIYAFLQLYHVAISIRRAGKKTELTSLILHGIVLQMSGKILSSATSYKLLSNPNRIVSK